MGEYNEYVLKMFEEVIDGDQLWTVLTTEDGLMLNLTKKFPRAVINDVQRFEININFFIIFYAYKIFKGDHEKENTADD